MNFKQSFSKEEELIKAGVIDNKGEINAYDKKHLLQQTRKIQQMENKISSEDLKFRKEVLSASVADRESLQVLAETVTEEVNTVVARDGVVRNFLSVTELEQGDTFMLRNREKNAMAFTATGAGSVSAVRYDDRNYIYPKEFAIKGKTYIDEVSVMQTNADLLGEMYEDTLEAVMTREDKIFKSLLDSTTNIENKLQYYTTLSPKVIGKTIEQITKHGYPASNLLVGSDLWITMISEIDFMQVLDPITQYEIVRTGRIGTILGVSVYTDVFRTEKLRFIEPGEFYVVTTPDRLGGMSTRGAVEAKPLEGAEAVINDVDVVGWKVKEIISMAVTNSKAVAKATRID